MSGLDWFVMGGTIFLIVAYGIWKSRGSKDIKGYLLSDNEMKWWTIGLSIMATQASAITFLSTPGQAFEDGMRFVQFYFGVPIAMVIISMVAIPIYHRLKVYTAYEYLEQRFDLKTRTLGAILFLIQRGMGAGLTIYAPAIILATLMDWDIKLTSIGIGLIVMAYTVSGGTKAVSYTQQQQMVVILIGMIIAGVIMVLKLPPEVSFGDAIQLAGNMGKLNVITLPDGPEDYKDRYNLFAGLIAGTFLALSYFGTDQSQVQRYLGGKSIAEIRIGLLFNGIFKVPMQFLILFLGVMLFVFYQFNPAPLVFNDVERAAVVASEYGEDYLALENQWNENHELKKEKLFELNQVHNVGDEAQIDLLKEEIIQLNAEANDLKARGKKLMKEANENADTTDQDRVFLTFVLNELPIGVVGLLIAVILSAAMSSTSAELNALATTSVIDIYKRIMRPRGSPTHYLNASKYLTLFWGLLAIGFALIAGNFENLIEFVNILGSLFYGTMLGMFVVAFFVKSASGTPVFWAGILAESIVLLLFFLPKMSDDLAYLDVGYLWFNLIGCVLVILFTRIFMILNQKS